VNVALTTVFTALYAVLGFLRISPIIGLTGQAITAAAIIAPIIGMLLGPYIGALSAFLGGTIGLFLGSLSYPSFAGGIATAFCAGMIRTGKRAIAALVYLTLFLLFAFYPVVGPAWVFPPETWFQIVGLIILLSPLQSFAKKLLDSQSSTRLMYGFFFTCLVSTLAGQIAGSLVFEILAAGPNAVNSTWQTTWLTLTGLYPIERTIIALAGALIGTALTRILKSASLPPSVSRSWRARTQGVPEPELKVPQLFSPPSDWRSIMLMKIHWSKGIIISAAPCTSSSKSTGASFINTTGVRSAASPINRCAAEAKSSATA